MSLVQRAQPMLGERVAVVGAGLIGLLTAWVLVHSTGGVSAVEMAENICVVDIRQDRLELVTKLIPGCLVYNPRTRILSQHGKVIPFDNNILIFDIAIELSGTIPGLETAISLTRDFGKVIIGSLYGEKAQFIRLGMKFHRSNIKLISSQVSLIPEEYSYRWSKSRRFGLSWKMIRLLKPSVSSYISTIIHIYNYLYYSINIVNKS